MDVNDDAGILDTRGAFETIASKLAPTEGITGFEWSELPWICDLRGAYWDWRYCRRCLSPQANANAWWSPAARTRRRTCGKTRRIPNT
ncbi:hypothetical protein D3C76_1674940 [compost metagenome]